MGLATVVMPGAVSGQNILTMHYLSYFPARNSTTRNWIYTMLMKLVIYKATPSSTLSSLIKKHEKKQDKTHIKILTCVSAVCKKKKLLVIVIKTEESMCIYADTRKVKENGELLLIANLTVIYCLDGVNFGAWLDI
ncbi:hypothetical protein HK096_008441 [Nowakowskiella sp. JEL0078]|nr:hypothetical protein HK096_008441 [Nowakowskiella sp. JEL0078]